MKWNDIQSPLSELGLENYPQEVQDQFWEFIQTVPYIQSLISDDLPSACDLPRDKKGRAIIDLTKPHRLEDMDYFRPAALTYLKTGKYTNLRPNSNPNSEYGKWVREEVRRCLEGYVRESDGEWIPGDLYFFWNYCPILVVKKDKEGVDVRTEDFPFVWGGHYYKFHYLDQARHQGKHAVELSRRGSGKSYSGASLLAKRFVLGERPSKTKNVGCVAVASDRKYIQGADQLLDKFVTYIDFLALNTQFPARRLANSVQNMNWFMGYVDMSTGARMGTLNFVKGITARDNEAALRGSRGSLYVFEEAGTFPRLKELYNVTRDSVEQGGRVHGQLYLYGCCCAGTKIRTCSGELKNIEDLKLEDGVLGFDGEKIVPDKIKQFITLGEKPCVEIELTNGNKLKCSIDHPIYSARLFTPSNKENNNKRDGSYNFSFVEAQDLKVGDYVVEARKCCNKDYSFPLRKIKSITDIGIQKIYNLEVENTHTYLANDIITHNTAGDSDSDFASLQELMYNAKGYNVYCIRNVFDKGGQGRPTFTYFFPAYMNREGCYDKDGNSNVTKALLEILHNRYIVKYNTTDLNAITSTISQQPITPQEAIVRSKNNMFPVTELSQRLSEIDNNPSFFDNIYVGNIALNSKGELSFDPTSDRPIRDYPLKDNKAAGALEIYEMPRKDPSGKVFSQRYIMGLDPIDQDDSQTLSLFSFFVLDLWTDRLVAEYTGRMAYADDCYELARKTCLFYNARCLYEQNKKGIYAYFLRMNSLYLLAETPEYLRDKNIIKSRSYGNNALGVNATAGVNSYADRLIRDWLMKKVPVIVEDGEGGETEVTTFNLMYIQSRALLKELILYDNLNNFDRVRALGMLMLYREEYMALYGGDPSRSEEMVSKDYLGEDDYFKTNYDKRFSNNSPFN